MTWVIFRRYLLSFSFLLAIIFKARSFSNLSILGIGLPTCSTLMSSHSSGNFVICLSFGSWVLLVWFISSSVSFCSLYIHFSSGTTYPHCMVSWSKHLLRTIWYETLFSWGSLQLLLNVVSDQEQKCASNRLIFKGFCCQICKWRMIRFSELLNLNCDFVGSLVHPSLGLNIWINCSTNPIILWSLIGAAITSILLCSQNLLFFFPTWHQAWSKLMARIPAATWVEWIAFTFACFIDWRTGMR